MEAFNEIISRLVKYDLHYENRCFISNANSEKPLLEMGFNAITFLF